MTHIEQIRHRCEAIPLAMLEGLVNGLKQRALADMKAGKSDEARIAYAVAAAELQRRRSGQ